MPYSMMLDSGHGGSDPGAVYRGRREKDDTLRLTLAVGEILQENGIEVLYTRTTDVYLSPYERAVEANQAGVDFFLSIHRNSYPTDNEVMGVESLIYDLSGLKYQMAQEINEQLETVGFVDLGVKARPNLVVLKRTRMPAVLVEAGFINSDTDNELFDSNFQDIAQAIATGVLDTLENAGVLKEPERRMISAAKSYHEQMPSPVQWYSPYSWVTHSCRISWARSAALVAFFEIFITSASLSRGWFGSGRKAASWFPQKR